MAHRREKIYEGKSEKGFADAAEKAFEGYKREVLKGKSAPNRIRFRIADMYIVASNPIHDYIVELEQIQP